MSYKKAKLSMISGEGTGETSLLSYTGNVYNDVDQTSDMEKDPRNTPINESFYTNEINAEIIKSSNARINNGALISIGENSTANGNNSTVIGEGNTASSEETFILGSSNIAQSPNVFIQGIANNVNASNSIAYGFHNDVGDGNSNSVVIGTGLITKKAGQIIIGQYNKEDSDSLFILANGTESDRKNVFTIDSKGGVHATDFYIGGKQITQSFYSNYSVSGTGNAITDITAVASKLVFAKNETFCLKEDFTNLKNSLYDLFVPVGKIIITSDNNFDPNNLYTGTKWERVKDVFILASGDVYNNGETGGEAEVELTIQNLPNHKHDLAAHNHKIPVLHGVAATAGKHKHSMAYANTVNDIASGFSLGTNLGYLAYTDEGGAHTHAVTTSESTTEDTVTTTRNTGSGVAHNNIPPYRAFNVWERIS